MIEDTVHLDETISLINREPVSSITLTPPTTIQIISSHRMLKDVPYEEGVLKQMHYLVWQCAGHKDSQIIDRIPYTKFRELMEIIKSFLNRGDQDTNDSSVS